MTQDGAAVIGRCVEAARDWFPRVAEELEMLEAGERSWRSDAACRLRAIVEEHGDFTAEDGDVLAVIALELAGEEDHAALDQGLVTWRSLAADELADLADVLRGIKAPRVWRALSN